MMESVESWEVLKNPKGDCLHGLPDDVKDRQYPCVDVDLLIEDLDKGKIYCLPKKGQMPAVIIGNKKDFDLASRKDEDLRTYFIDIEGEKDSTLICMYKGRNELKINAVKVGKGTYVNEKLIGEIPEKLENVADLRVGTRRFRITHKYSSISEN